MNMKKVNLIFILIIVFIELPLLAGTKYYRASYRDDPATTIVIGWCDDGTSTNAIVYYGTQDFGTNHSQYPFQSNISRSQVHRGQTNRFARITGLQPETTYYFVIKDDQSISPRMSFRTLSDNPNVPLVFISGGDTRTGVPVFEFEAGECIPRRQRGNALVAKIRPDFVAFSGDYVFSGTNNSQWADWLSDWQLTIGPEGRLIPIVPIFGNHEDSQDIYHFFDIPNSNAYFSLSMGGNLLRLYSLNSDMGCDPVQLNWLTNDLQLHTGTSSDPYWKAIQYHIPLVPHGEYSPMTSLISCWATLFTPYKVKLAMEGHTHVQKITWPIVTSSAAGSDNGFIRDDVNGTVYIGEGCWGAPLRNLYTYHNSSAAFNWTRNQGKFTGFMIVTVTKQKIEIKTAVFHNASDVANVTQVQPNDPPGTLPSGISYWAPSNGAIVEILSDNVLSNNADLSSLSVSQGNLQPAFSPAVTSYTVDLPGNTTSVPTLSAVAAHPGAYVAISQATSLTGAISERTAAVIVTAEDGVTLKSYTVVFNLLPISDADLISLQTSAGILNPVFQPAIYNYSVVLPFGTVDVPHVIAIPSDPLAFVEIIQPVTPDGFATVQVTSADSLLTNTYSVNYFIASSTDNHILSFVVPAQIGTSVIDNVNNTIHFTMPFNYNITALVPQVIHNGVSVIPQSGQPQNFSQNIQYTVYSADNTPRAYTVFVDFAEAGDNAHLMHLEVVNQQIIPSFISDHFLYFCELPQDDPEIIATPEDPAATVKIFHPEDIYGNSAQRTANVLVIAPDFSTIKIYMIVFGSITENEDISVQNDIIIFPNPAVSLLSVSIPSAETENEIQVFSGLGHQVYYSTIKGENSVNIDCHNWANGTYYIIIRDGSGNVNRGKFMINK
jgi:hypothetical protein